MGGELLVVSNGRGEDYVAARVVSALRAARQDIEVAAFPLVGEGELLAAEGIEVVGPRRRLPSDGFTFHDPALLWRDLRAGLVALTARQAAFLSRRRPAAVLVVGDVYAQAQAALARAPRRVLQTLVSVHHEGGDGLSLRYFMEGFRAPELVLLRRADRVYARDEATAGWLREAGVRSVWLGNPMMDGLAAPLVRRDEAGTPVVALLPGSRGQAASSAGLMRRALELAPPVLGLVAWTGGEPPAPPEGWQPDTVGVTGLAAAWRSGERRLWWVRDRFAAVLAAADAAIATAGTAAEQAVGLGLPVVAFPLPPFYSEAYMRNQRRLLGGGVLVARPSPRSVADMLALALGDEATRRNAAAAGRERMGPPGASAAIAADLAAWLGEGATNGA